MLISLVVLVGVLAPVTRAATATIFPVGLGPAASLHGEIIGTGGEVGTTYVLSGETSGIPFTLTLAEDASLVAEKIVIPTLSLDLDVGCVVSAGSAICQNVLGSGTAATTLPPTTIAFSPFAVVVSSGTIAASTTSASASATSTVATASTATILSSVTSSQSTITPSSTVSSALVTTATSPSTNLASPSASQSSTSGSSRVFAAGTAFVLPLAVALALWALV